MGHFFMFASTKVTAKVQSRGDGVFYTKPNNFHLAK